jgi:tRNA(Ile)-lysidine synthase
LEIALVKGDEMSTPPFLAAAAGKIDELIALACPQVARPGLLVALSGGPDSVALLMAAHSWSLSTGNPVEAAHLDHTLRGEESRQDALFCRDLCLGLGITLHTREEDPRPVAQLRGLGLEEAGRHLRLVFFDHLLAENPHLHCLAKGHHRDDQAETVIMRLFRGTGPEGLAGIRPVTDQVIHPLLGFNRSDILAFLEEIGQPWRNDASNLEGDNTRSRLRRELLPLVRDIFGQGCDQTPARLAELQNHDQLYLDQLAARAGAGLADDREGVPGLNVPGLLELPVALALRVIRGWLLEGCGADPGRLQFSHVMNILDWLRVGQSGGGLDLADGLRVIRDFDRIYPETEKAGLAPGRPAADYRILVQKMETPADPVALGLTEGTGTPNDREGWNLSVPSSVLQGNLKVRNPRPGDRFQPFGLDGTRKLSDLFRERRVPDSRRPEILLVEDDAGILWVVGLARSERTRLLPTTGSMVTICVARR